MRALVLAGSDITVTAALLTLAQSAALIVAADSGLRHAHSLGVTPTLLVGDFDSITPEILARHPDLPREVHPPEKDALDLELALEHATRAGATELIIAGALGGRLDQSLAAILITARLKQQGTGVYLHSGDSQAHILTPGETLELELPVRQRFSVLSLAEASVISIENARYPLNHHRLEFGVGLGVSNEVTAPPLRLTLTEGLVVLLVG